jgi:GNAT superfamily N-acetyltransferase
MSNLQVRPLQLRDRQAWEPLARGYKEFYNTPTSDAEFDAAWLRLMSPDGTVLALGAKLEGELVGIAHYLFHASTWAPSVCYLQDLFTSPAARGKGVARALIEAVASHAHGRGAQRFYWLTQEHNQVARILHDQIAQFNGFIRYDFALPPSAG